MLIIEEEQPEALAQEPEENKQAAAQDAEDGHPDDDDEDAFGENDSEDEATIQSINRHLATAHDPEHSEGHTTMR